MCGEVPGGFLRGRIHGRGPGEQLLNLLRAFDGQVPILLLFEHAVGFPGDHFQNECGDRLATDRGSFLEPFGCAFRETRIHANRLAGGFSAERVHTVIVTRWPVGSTVNGTVLAPTGAGRHIVGNFWF